MSDPSTKQKKSDVVVVGAGPFGWACAQLLAQNGIKTILLDPHSAGTPESWCTKGLGVFWPALNDPPTRAVVAHGEEMAQWLQDFCSQGLHTAQRLLGAENLVAVPSLRLGIEKHETLELSAASEKNLGIEPSSQWGEGFFCEKNDALVLTSSGLLKIKNQCHPKTTHISAAATSMRDSKDGCKIVLSDGSPLQCEMVILAAGYKIAALEPWLANMLVPMTDVMSVWSTNLPVPKHYKAPVAIRASSGHVAAVFFPVSNKQKDKVWGCKITGPRFLLPGAGAGVDLTHLPFDPQLPVRIEQWLREKLLPKLAPVLNDAPSHPLNANALTLNLENITLGVDCLPCDELPMLGEIGHQGRIIGATGWLGCGWSAGFRAAEIVTEIITSGSSGGLKPLLRPKRWRSGLNDGVTGMT